jgi:hypothetical protein
MHTYSPNRLAMPKPRALGLAIALAFCAAPAMAGTATVNITSFTVSAADFSGNFAFATDAFQSYTMTALEAGGLLGAQGPISFSAPDWNLGLNQVAQTANAKATGNTVNFTDVATQLTTAGFNLSAQATAAHSPPLLPNYANATAGQEGTFVLLDGDGQLTGGTITFDLFYDMNVATPGSTAANYSQTTLNLLRSTDTQSTTSFADGLLSNSLTDGTGSIMSGHYSWTYALAVGEAAYYTLSGSAIASAELAVAAVPEPETYALMLLGLAGIGVVKRRRGAKPAAASD